MKNKLKKAMSQILALTIILGGFSISASAETQAEYKIETEFDLLKTLEIIEEEADFSEVDLSAEISRGDFAIYFANLINVPPASGSLYYNDVPKTHYAYEAITTLTDYGYLNGTGEKKFNPDDIMQTQYVYPMIIKALGLNLEGMQKETYKEIQEKILMTSDIKEGVSSSQNLIYSDMIRIFFNALISGTYQINYVTGSGDNEEASYSYTSETLLSVTRKMQYIKGVQVTAMGGADIYGIENDPEVAVIDGVKYNNTVARSEEFIGRYVDFVYYYGNGTDRDDIVWIKKSNGAKELEVTIDESGSISATQGKLTYYDDNGRERSAIIAKGAAVIYNGRFSDKKLSDILNSSPYDAVLIKSKSSGAYDIVAVWQYNNMIADSKDDDILTVYNKNGSEKLCLDEQQWESMIICDESGNEKSYGDIQEGDVLSIFKSFDEKFVKVIICTKTLKGKVEGIKSDGDAVIGGNTYEIYRNTSLNLTVGTQVLCKLDFKGYIVDVETDYKSSDTRVGYLIDGTCQGSFNTDAKIKILNESGEIEILDLYTNVKVDGVRFECADAVAKLSDSGSVTQQIIMYGLNSEGQINRIFTASDTPSDTDAIFKSGEIDSSLDSLWKGTYKKAQKKLGKKFLVDTSTVVFFVPENAEDSTDKDFSTGSLIEDRDYRGSVAYKTNKNNIFEEYIVVKQPDTVEIKQTSQIYMVNEISTVLNENEEIVKSLECINGTETLSFCVGEDYDIEALGLKRGDAVQLGLDKNDEVQDLKVIYKTGGEVVNDDDMTEWPDLEGRILICYANERQSNVLKVGYTSGSVFDEIFNIPSDKPVAVYDAERDTVTNGTLNDIRCYTSAGSDASVVIIKTNYSIINQVIIYR